MKKLLFNNQLEFEINLIGYKDKGECIVFFLKTDGKVAYSGLVDCYKTQMVDVISDICTKEKVAKFDFICWTHPHDDHTVGMIDILRIYTHEKTQFWMPEISKAEKEGLSENANEIYGELFKHLESIKRKKFIVRTVANCTRLERLYAYGKSTKPYLFEITTFAPDSNVLLEKQARSQCDMGNDYSIGLIINVGELFLILAGDVENKTLKRIPRDYLELNAVDYLKIPHHTSKSADELLNILYAINRVPHIVSTTVYRNNGLPNKDVLESYCSYSKEVYSTGALDKNDDKSKCGVVRTVFDVLRKREFPIETYLEGNGVAIKV